LSTASNIRFLALAEAGGNGGGKAAGLSRSRNRDRDRARGIGSLGGGESGEAKRDDNSGELHFD